MTITMKATVKVVGIKKPSHAKVLDNTQIGDILEFSLPIMNTRQYNKTYASCVKVINLRTGQSDLKTLNVMARVLERFELEQIYSK